MEELKDIYNRVKQYYKEDSPEFMSFLKEEIEKNIGIDNSILLHYEVDAKKNADCWPFDSLLSFFAFLLVVIEIFQDFIPALFSSLECVIVLIVLVMVVYLTYHYHSIPKYETIQVVLNEIEKEWDLKRSHL